MNITFRLHTERLTCILLTFCGPLFSTFRSPKSLPTIHAGVTFGLDLTNMIPPQKHKIPGDIDQPTTYDFIEHNTEPTNLLTLPHICFWIKQISTFRVATLTLTHGIRGIRLLAYYSSIIVVSFTSSCIFKFENVFIIPVWDFRLLNLHNKLLIDTTVFCWYYLQLKQRKFISEINIG